MVEEGIIVKFPLVPFAMCLLHLQLLLQGSFHQEEVCRFVKESMLLLDGISVGGQSIGEREGSSL